MHLIKAPSGIFHFRMRIPKEAQPYFQNRNEIKRSLMTRKKRIAQPIANKFYGAYMKKIREVCTTLNDIDIIDDDGYQYFIRHDTPEQERETARVLMESRSKAHKTSPETKLNLPDLIEQYLSDTKDSVTDRTQTERRGALRAYMSISSTIDHESANKFSDTLKKLPPGFSKDNILEQSKLKHKKVISGKTHNKYIGFLSAFNNWLSRRGEIDKNYFSGLKMKKNTQAHLERDPYTQEEITLLLHESSMLTGFKYWLPRLGLYTGCRIGELSQLYILDVITEDGILCLRISSGLEGQHLKNMSSNRTVPIHPNLREEFKEYLETLTGDRVFPELTWTKASYWGGLSSKWFGRFRKKTGLKPTFHALRHTFASSLQAKDVDTRIISELLGHSSPEQTTGRYTGKRNAVQLLKAVKLLKFD